MISLVFNHVLEIRAKIRTARLETYLSVALEELAVDPGRVLERVGGVHLPNHNHDGEVIPETNRVPLPERGVQIGCAEFAADRLLKMNSYSLQPAMT
jgi:hypothetical protein